MIQMAEKFIDDKYVNLERDIDKVQKKTNMYIGYRGGRGALHLAKELINNMIDEMINPNSPANTTWIELDEATNRLTVKDNGRGIPFDQLENVCTLLQSGSKMDRDGGGGTAGENGVGLTATNALSQKFTISSSRYGEKKTLYFESGNKVDETIEKVNKNDHGSEFSFIPHEVLLSNGNQLPIIDHEGLHQWLSMVSYLLPEDLEMHYLYTPLVGDGVDKVFKNEGGQLAHVKDMYGGKFVTKPIHFKDEVTVTEDDRGVVKERDVLLEVAVGFHDRNQEIIKDSFCNFINTIDHGTHMEAVEQTIANELTKLTRDSLSDRDKENLSIKYSDAYASMVISINVTTDVDPQFSGQVKEKVGSTTLSEPLRRITRDAMREYIEENPKAVDKITKVIRSNARDRYNSDKLREARKSVSNKSKIDMLRNQKYIPPSVTSRREYSEVLVVEGMSAGQSIRDVGARFQGAIQLKGVPINALTKSEARVISNEEIATFVAAGEGGMGADFDSKKFIFDKVIIMTDGDIDGNKIFSSFLAFLMVYMPDLIKEKRVYRVLAPLYQIDDKDDEFVLDKRHYAEVFLRNIGNNVKIIDVGGEHNHQLSHDEFREFLELNASYLDELRRISKLFNAHPDVIEFILYNLGKEVSEFNKAATGPFSEMELGTDKSFSGIYEGEFQFVMINKRFINKVVELIDILHKNSALRYDMYTRTSDGYERIGNFTIGELLADWERYRPKIVKRFKGLGELKPRELRDRVLSPKNRLLVRITTEDLDKAMETMLTLHGDKKEHRQARRDMIDAHVVHRDEIDN